MPAPPRRSPDDLVWLARQIEDSPLLPEAALRAHWRTLLPWLDADARYALAATLLWAQQSVD